MKALFINGGPRKNWTTVKMMEQTMKGATDSGAETELIHLNAVFLQRLPVQRLFQV